MGFRSLLHSLQPEVDRLVDGVLIARDRPIRPMRIETKQIEQASRPIIDRFIVTLAFLFVVPPLVASGPNYSCRFRFRTEVVVATT